MRPRELPHTSMILIREEKEVTPLNFSIISLFKLGSQARTELLYSIFFLLKTLLGEYLAGRLTDPFNMKGMQ